MDFVHGNSETHSFLACWIWTGGMEIAKDLPVHTPETSSWNAHNYLNL
jgi:hypothetical protein